MAAQGEFDIPLTRVCHPKVMKCIDVFFFFLTQVPPKVKVNLPKLHHPVTEGDNVTLTCNITDGVPNQIRWLKDKNYLDDKTTNLVLWDIKKEQEGTYTCEASNGAGSANDSIKIIVHSKIY